LVATLLRAAARPASSTGPSPICPRHRFTFASSPPAGPGSTTTDASTVPFTGTSNDANRIEPPCVSFQPFGSVHRRPAAGRAGGGTLPAIAAGAEGGAAGGGALATR
jgi:hypothetical protein